jgi:hypothetical protein
MDRRREVNKIGRQIDICLSDLNRMTKPQRTKNIEALREVNLELIDLINKLLNDRDRLSKASQNH